MAKRAARPSLARPALAHPNNRARPGRPAGRPVGPGLAYMALMQAVPGHWPVRPNRLGGPLKQHQKYYQ
jgi:hypothetical protein